MMVPIAFGLFGLIVGSFLNVVILRHGARSLSGRSACFSCGARISWYDLVPVLSYLALRGRCRACESAISLQYPLVEAATALAFFTLSLSGLPPLSLALSAACAALLIAIAAYDLRHTIIPDGWVYAFGSLALLLSLGSGSFGIMTLIAGPISALPLLLLWAVSSGRWMGLGDVKLALGMGWLLGTLHGLIAVFFAFVLGCAFFLPLIALSRLTPKGVFGAARTRFTMKSEVPFGPFLIASTFLLWSTILFAIPLPIP